MKFNFLLTTVFFLTKPSRPSPINSTNGGTPGKEALVEIISTIDQSEEQLSKVKQFVDDKWKELDADTYQQLKASQKCFNEHLKLDKQAASLIPVLTTLYTNADFAALGKCLPEKFDKQMMASFSKVIFDEDEYFLEDILTNLEKLLRTENFIDLIKFIEVLDSSPDEQKYLTNIYIGLTKSVSEMKTGKSQGFKDFFKYCDCLSKKKKITYGKLVQISTIDVLKSGSKPALVKFGFCQLGEIGLQKSLQLVGKFLMDSGFFRSADRADKGDESGGRKRREAALNTTVSVEVKPKSSTPSRTPNPTVELRPFEEPKKEQKVSDLKQLFIDYLMNLFNIDMVSIGNTAAWNTRIKKITATINNDSCLKKLIKSEKTKKELDGILVSPKKASFLKFFYNDTCTLSNITPKKPTNHSPYRPGYNKRPNKNKKDQKTDHGKGTSKSSVTIIATNNTSKNLISPNDIAVKANFMKSLTNVLDSMNTPTKLSILLVAIFIIFGMIFLCRKAMHTSSEDYKGISNEKMGDVKDGGDIGHKVGKMKKIKTDQQKSKHQYISAIPPPIKNENIIVTPKMNMSSNQISQMQQGICMSATLPDNRVSASDDKFIPEAIALGIGYQGVAGYNQNVPQDAHNLPTCNNNNQTKNIRGHNGMSTKL